MQTKERGNTTNMSGKLVSGRRGEQRGMKRDEEREMKEDEEGR